MYLHPLLLGALVLDLLGVLLVLAAGWKACGILTGWQAETPTPRQLALERAAEVATSQLNWALALTAASSTLLILSISNILPAIVPGAMCGTGVMQAAEPYGQQALWLRGIALAALYWQAVVGRLNSHSHRALLATAHARFVLVALPLVVLSLYATLRFTFALDVHQAVDCCAVVYDAVRDSVPAAAAAPSGGRSFLLGAWGIGGGLLIASGMRIALVDDRQQRSRGILVLALTVIWVPLAFLSLTQHLCVYFYQVLAHRCPWCLLLPEHRFAGFPLYAMLYGVWLEGPVFALCAYLGNKYPPLTSAAKRRSRRAGWHIAVFSGGFMLLAVLPAVWWRWEYGVWMG
jgi:hypothetical protein